MTASDTAIGVGLRRSSLEAEAAMSHQEVIPSDDLSCKLCSLNAPPHIMSAKGFLVGDAKARSYRLPSASRLRGHVCRCTRSWAPATST